MKKIIIIAILLISNLGIFGTVNTGGEKNTNSQEIVTNETVQEIRVVEEQSKQEENVVKIADETENKQEESKADYQEQVTVNKEIQKEQTTPKTNVTDNAVNNKPETKKVEQKPQEDKQQEQKKEQQVVTNQQVQETKPTQENKVKQCTNGKHAIEVGNSKKWFNTEQEAINFYNTTQKKWSDKWTNYEITDEEYDKNCPYGYETWDCPNCQKWTINFYYR